MATLANADVTIQSFDSGKLFVMARLSGTISLQDVRMVQRILDLKDDGQHFVLTVESNGGDWYSAIRLGRILREKDAAVWVGKEGCHSRTRKRKTTADVIVRYSWAYSCCNFFGIYLQPFPGYTQTKTDYRNPKAGSGNTA